MKTRLNRKQKRRVWTVLGTVCVLLIALSTRLFLIQITDHQKYSVVSERQHRITLDGADCRGVIYDRNGNPLTDASDSFVYLIEKERMNQGTDILLEKIGASAVRNDIGQYEVFRTSHYDKDRTETLKQDYGAFLLKLPQRYGADPLAVHLIGYVNRADDRGASGLEKDYDWLLSSGKNRLTATGDGKGRILPGMGIRQEGVGDFGLITTLDERVQREAERILKASGKDGAIIVSEAASGAVLACASTPVYNPNHVDRYLGSGKQELINKAVQSQYPPGSIFKIVVAAAALEGKQITPNSNFFCPGYGEADGLKIRCASGGAEGHGSISFSDGFAQSCNAVFIQTGQKTEGEAIVEMAEKFGLGAPVLGLSEEKKGVLPGKGDYQGAGIANLSIGQGKLLITPIQANRMTKIVAAGGVDTGLYLIKGYLYNGKVTELQHQQAKRVISPSTAQTLTNMMRQTVISGSADNLSADLSLHAGGKTGTAQAEAGMVHGWFTGFFPVEAPRYVITVFVENGRSGRGAAVPLFASMADFLHRENLR